jgi:hypothetical protein
MQISKSKSGKVWTRTTVIQLQGGRTKTQADSHFVGSSKGELRKLKSLFHNTIRHRGAKANGGNQVDTGLSRSMSASKSSK